MSRKSPALAAFLSFILPGLGQFYAGEGGMGIMFIIFDLVCYFLAASVVGLIFGVPLYLIVVIWSMVSASKASSARNAAIDMQMRDRHIG